MSDDQLSSAEQLRARLPHLALDELSHLASVDRARYPEQVDMVEAELARRGVTGTTSEGRHHDLSSHHENTGWQRWLNPTMPDDRAALRVTRQGAIAAWVVTGTTVLAVLLAQKVQAFAAAGFSVWSLLDASIFMLIGFRIWKGSLSFAWAGLVLFLIERGFAWAMTGRFPGGLAVFIFLAFLNGVRGAGMLARYRNTQLPANEMRA
jgi:hypothetical protein